MLHAITRSPVQTWGQIHSSFVYLTKIHIHSFVNTFKYKYICFWKYFRYKYFTNEKNRLISFPLLFILMHHTTASRNTACHMSSIDYTWVKDFTIYAELSLHWLTEADFGAILANDGYFSALETEWSLIVIHYDHRQKTVPL